MPACICGHTPRLKVLSKKVFRPSPVEVQTNPRSRSARTRVAECI
jgi:16S rRNA (cytosine1402-N4)-methyltransferase